MPRVGHRDPGDLLAEPEGDREVAQVELQRLDDLGVAEVEHLGPALDDGDAGPERGEHRGVLDADHPGADDDHAGRDLLHREDAVGVDDAAVVELDLRGPCGSGAGGDDDLGGGDRLVLAAPVPDDLDGVLVDEPGGAAEQVDPVALQLRADHLLLAADDEVGAREQVLDGDVLLDPVALAVEPAHRVAGEVEDGLAQGLRRDRAGLRADAADHAAPFDDRDPPAELGGRDRRLLPARTRADDQQVVVVGRLGASRGALGDGSRDVSGGDVRRGIHGVHGPTLAAAGGPGKRIA